MVDILIKEEEVAEATTMDCGNHSGFNNNNGGFGNTSYHPTSGNILSHKMPLANLSQISHFAKSMERVVT